MNYVTRISLFSLRFGLCLACFGLLSARAESGYGFGPPPAPGTHPRIVFSPSEAGELRERVKTGPAQEMFEKTRGATKQLADPNSNNGKLLARLEAGPLPQAETEQLAQVLRDGSLVAYITDDASLVEITKRTLLAMVAHVPTTLTEYSRISPGVAFGYDWLYGKLSAAEQDSVRKWLAAVCTTFYANLANQPFGFKPNSREQHNFNWVGMTTGAFGLTALGIEGEPGYRPEWFQNTATTFQDFLNFGIGAEGSPLESIHYFAYGMSNGAFVLDAMARRGKPVVQDSHLANVPLWWAYDMYPWGKDFNDLQDTRDITVGLGEIYYFLNMAYPSNPVMQWVYSNYVQSPNGGPGSPSAGILWCTPPHSEVTAADMKLRTARLFSSNGLAYMKSGWSPNDLYLEFQSDPIAAGPSHAHADRNSFTLGADGRLWVADGGGWMPQDIFHNLVLIDGRAEGFFPQRGKITEFKDTGWATAITGDAKDAYNWSTSGPRPNSAKINALDSAPYNAVKRAARTAVMVRGNHPYAMIVDDIRKDDAPHQYNWSFLTPLGNQFRALDAHRAVLGPADCGPSLSPGAAPGERQDPLKAVFTLRNSGEYRVWLLMGRDYWTAWNLGGNFAIDQGKQVRFYAREGDNARRHWQELPLEGKAPTIHLERGNHEFTLATGDHQMQFSALLVAPAAFDGITAEELKVPADAALVSFAELPNLPAGWKRAEAEANPAQLLVQILSPSASAISAAKFDRIRPDNKQDYGPEIKVSGIANVVEPKFRVMLYPHHKQDPMPVVTTDQNGAVVKWSDGTVDTWSFSGGTAVRRESPRGGGGSIQMAAAPAAP